MPEGLHLVLSFILAIVGAWALFGAPEAFITFGAIVVAAIIFLTLIKRSFR